jgi:hypothetical protein
LTQIAEYTVKKIYTTIALTLLLVMSLATFIQIPTVKAVDVYSFQFDGALNENTWGYLGGTNVTVRAYPYIGVTFDTFQFNSTNSPYIWNLSYVPIYFTYEWNLTTLQHREYWLSSNDNTNWTGTGQNYRCFFSTEDQTTYILSFLDYAGLLGTYPYIKISDGGTYNTVEKRLVDAQNTVSVSLVPGKTYDIWLSGATDYFYGTITPTYVTGIQLVVRDIDFTSLEAKKQLLLYQYVHAYAQRDFLNPTGAITVSYEDLTSKTTSVLVTITNNGTTVYSGTFTAQTFSYTWNSAVNATSYEVTVAVNHQTFGLFDFKQYLLGEYQKADEPFSLAFLGSSMGISTAMLIPALLIIFVAGCFSELTSEVAAILTVIVAIVLTSLGWIDIGQGAIISTLALAVMSGIVAMKRRQGY